MFYEIYAMPQEALFLPWDYWTLPFARAFYRATPLGWA